LTDVPDARSAEDSPAAGTRGGRGFVHGRAPAKVNLTLVVGPPGSDGYHPLLTVFVPIDLHDDLEFELEVAPGRGAALTVQCSGVDSEANLVTRALRALEAESGWGFTGVVRVGKGIPTGAGLGGGSSDCAQALLVGARRLADGGGPRVEATTIRRLALALGADVPFFLDPRPALATGVGQLLEPLALPELPLVLVEPAEELSTAEVYSTFDGVAACESAQAFARRAAQAERAWRALGAAWASGEVARPAFRAGLAGMLHNDLERASMHLLPDLAARKAALQRHGALGSAMSGSGPSVFGVCSSFTSAGRIAGALCREGTPARPVRTLGGSCSA
jgi:4-diphosphocytidyl-2-C-methyl-D-erythritol kinase